MVRSVALLAVYFGWTLVGPACLGQEPVLKPSGAESFQRALELAREHRYEEAANAIRGLAPPVNIQQRVAFFRLRASIESGLGQSAAAAADMESATKLAPRDVDLQIAGDLARLQAQVEARQSVMETLRRLHTYSLDAQHVFAVRLRTAEILSHGDRYDETATEFAEASQLVPDRADLVFNVALARYRNGEWDAALSAAVRAKTLQDSGSVESLLGDIQEKKGDALSAVRSYQAAVALEPGVEEHRLVLARELLKHQTFDAAIVVLEQAAGIFPQSPRVLILLGLSYYLVDRSADSVRALLQATKLASDDELATRYLGDIALNDSSAPDPLAVAQVCSFADAHPSNASIGALCGAVTLRVAEDVADNSHREQILSRLRRATQLAPAAPLANCQLGKALEWTQEFPAARVQLEKCVRLDPNSPEGHYRLARVYRKLGLTSLAVQQTALQQEAAQRQSEESTRKTNTVERFLVLLDR